MITKWNKPVRRRVGDLVVAIEEAGVRLRRPGRRRSVLIPWEWCEERFGPSLDGPRTRLLAFQTKAPRGWCPSPGEIVFVAAVPHTLCRCVSHGLVIRVIEQVPEPVIRVQLQYGRGRTEEMLPLSKTRPLQFWPD